MTDPLALKIKNAVASVLQKSPSVHKAVLFGSYAKGTHAPRSDVDIALYGDVDFLEVENIICDLDELPFTQKFDVIAYNLVDNTALREHITRVGVVVYEKKGNAP